IARNGDRSAQWTSGGEGAGVGHDAAALTAALAYGNGALLRCPACFTHDDSQIFPEHFDRW
ncbi:MAG: hypothetical protein ABI898_08280, partial [Sphingomonadales bacterium]